jgi:hypothetical protein
MLGYPTGEVPFWEKLVDGGAINWDARARCSAGQSFTT